MLVGSLAPPLRNPAVTTPSQFPVGLAALRYSLQTIGMKADSIVDGPQVGLELDRAPVSLPSPDYYLLLALVPRRPCSLILIPQPASIVDIRNTLNEPRDFNVSGLDYKLRASQHTQ